MIACQLLSLLLLLFIIIIIIITIVIVYYYYCLFVCSLLACLLVVALYLAGCRSPGGRKGRGVCRGVSIRGSEQMFAC